MEILGYVIGAWFLLLAARLALQLAGPLLLIAFVAACLYGCSAAQHEPATGYQQERTI